MQQNPNQEKESFQDRFIKRVLLHLKDNIDASGLLLKQGEMELCRIGECSGSPLESYDFEGGILYIYKTERYFSSKDISYVKSAKDLISLTLPSIRNITRKTEDNKKEVISSAAGIPLNKWVDSLMGLLNTLSLRSDFLKYYEQILKLNEKILLAHDLNAVLQAIADTAKDVVNAEGASLLLVDPDTGEMFFNVISGDNETELKEIRIPRGRGIAGDVVMKGRAELIADASSDPRTFQEVGEKLNSKTRDMIVVPIIARGTVIGVFEVINSLAGGFHDEDRDFLSNIGLHTGLLLENARSRDDLIKINRELDVKNTELTALYEIGRSLKTSLEMDILKEEFLKTTMRILKLKRACLFQRRPDNSLATVLSYSMTLTGPERFEKEILLSGATDIISWMVENHEPFFFSMNDEGEGYAPAKRFMEANPEYFIGENKPDVWVPIFSEDAKTVLYVLAIRTGSEVQKTRIYNRAFYGSLMDQAQMAFYNAKIYRQALDAREKEESIRQSFQKYVPAKVVEEILQQSEKPEPRALNVTTMFLDIKNFTGISETLMPTELVKLLNEFFEEMVDAVMHHNGIVDKFIGDAIMALFGVPQSSEKDADHAIAAALEIFKRLRSLNEKRLIENRIIFEITMGIHTGPAVAGNIGSQKRMDYTAIGDSVNLASRLQKISYLYKTPVIFTEDTLKLLNQEYPIREIDLIQVRGRTHSNKIFQLAENEELANKLIDIHSIWIDALYEYRKQEFKEALHLFGRSIDIYSDDPVCELYMERCRRFIEKPPEKDWKGVFKVDS